MVAFHSIKINQSKNTNSIMKNLNKNYLLFLFALLISIPMNAQLWGNKKVSGNGDVTTITRTTNDYDAIKCAGFMDFILVKGNEGNIKIEGEENLLKYIITEVKDNKLVVKVENGINLRTSWTKGIVITIPFEEISYVSLAGSGDVWNKDVIATDNFKVSLAGSGDLNLKVKAENLDSNISGSGDITIVGNTNNLKTSVTGSGDFHGFDLDANNTDVSVTGSGDAKVVSKKMLKAKVTGSGDIEYKGNPEKEDTKIVGSGSISN